jgi:hypothetical protein
MRKKEKNEDLYKIEKMIVNQIKQANQIQNRKVKQMNDSFKELSTFLDK